MNNSEANSPPVEPERTSQRSSVTTSLTRGLDVPNCSICLGEISNIAYLNDCLHHFCFKCIIEWSSIKRECPLCKAKFLKIIHSVRSDRDYKVHLVEARRSLTYDASIYGDFENYHNQLRIFRRATHNFFNSAYGLRYGVQPPHGIGETINPRRSILDSSDNSRNENVNNENVNNEGGCDEGQDRLSQRGTIPSGHSITDPAAASSGIIYSSDEESAAQSCMAIEERHSQRDLHPIRSTGIIYSSHEESSGESDVSIEERLSQRDRHSARAQTDASTGIIYSSDEESSSGSDVSIEVLETKLPSGELRLRLGLRNYSSCVQPHSSSDAIIILQSSEEESDGQNSTSTTQSVEVLEPPPTAIKSRNVITVNSSTDEDDVGGSNTASVYNCSSYQQNTPELDQLQLEVMEPPTTATKCGIAVNSLVDEDDVGGSNTSSVAVCSPYQHISSESEEDQLNYHLFLKNQQPEVLNPQFTTPSGTADAIFPHGSGHGNVHTGTDPRIIIPSEDVAAGGSTSSVHVSLPPTSLQPVGTIVYSSENDDEHNDYMNHLHQYGIEKQEIDPSLFPSYYSMRTTSAAGTEEVHRRKKKRLRSRHERSSLTSRSGCYFACSPTVSDSNSDSNLGIKKRRKTKLNASRSSFSDSDSS